MATIGNTSLTYADWAKLQDPDGSVAKVAEMLNQSNPILDDMLWMEGNLPTGHKTTVRTGLPTATWRQLNYGVPKGKSTTAQITDTCGMLETYSEIDKSLADLNGNTAAFRLSEDRAFLEGMNQQMATAMFYGNSATDPEQIMGLAPRYNSLSAGNATNIIDFAGNDSDLTSVWLLVWGDLTMHGIFPKGSKMGLSQSDKGEQTLQDEAGGQYQGYRSHYKWDCGLTLRDWRYGVRIANIDVSALASDTTGALIKALIKAQHKIPNMGMGRAAIYCNRAVSTWLDIQALDKSNVTLGRGEWAGKMVTDFRGIPIRQCDAITNTETRVT